MKGNLEAPAPSLVDEPKMKTRPWFFAARFSSFVTVGYLLATIPQTILDPRLTSQIRYGPRIYPSSWLISPIAFGVLLATFIACRFTRSATVSTLPFAAGILASIPLFPPELPNGNLTFIGVVWFAVALIATWIHYVPLTNPGKVNPRPSAEAQRDFAKEQAQLWRTVALGIIGSYLALIIGFIDQVHKYNPTIVTKPGEVFLINVYSHIQIALISLFVLAGPIAESTAKIVEANSLILETSPSDHSRGAA